MSKILIVLLVLAALIIPVFGTSLSMSGASQSEVVWQNHNLLDKGVPVLNSATYDTLLKNPGLTFGVTVSGRKTVYFGTAIPKDIETRKATTTRTATFGLSGPAITKDGGNANAYIIMGRKWNTSAPTFKKVVMSLKNDAYLAGTGLSKTSALAAIAADEVVWNNATNQKPFSGTSTLTTTANWKYDGVNNMAFTPYAVGCSALAATGVWYKTQGIPSGQMYPIVESDMTINSRLKWTCDPAKEPSKLDFQSVVLHELGHTLGLGDIYNKAAFSKDTRQVMHYYTGVKRTLGNGDATGVWKLYG